MPCDSRAVIRMRQDAYAFDALADNAAIPEIIREWLAEQTGATVRLESEVSQHETAYLSAGQRLAFLVGEGVWASWVSIRPDGVQASDRLMSGNRAYGGYSLDPAKLESFLNELSFLSAVYATSEVVSDVQDNAGYRTLTIRA